MDRQIANGLALLLDNSTLTVDWPWLLNAEPELYSAAAIERLGQMSTAEWVMAHDRDPREVSAQIGEIDSLVAGRYGRIGRLLEMCAQDGVERAVATFDRPDGY